MSKQVSKKSLVVGLLGSLFLMAVSCPPAQAVFIEFDFNALSDGASNAAVQNYMQGIISLLHPGGTVTVSGSRGEKDYTGDRHVVGPVNGTAVASETLGTSDGSIHHEAPLDTFIINRNSPQVTMLFSFPVYEVSFDYEIFPDETCPNEACSAANWPDFTFEADDVMQFKTLGIVPGEAGTYPHSPRSGPVNNEQAPQFLGISGDWKFQDGVTKLEFIDWPRLIGIDNLTVNNHPPVVTEEPVVPEPSSLWLLASGLFSFLGVSSLRRSPTDRRSSSI